MKTIIGAIALAFAVPAFAQVAQPADPHAQHKGTDHSQHEKAKHDCMECCKKMMGKEGKMECMDKGEAKPAATDADAHQGHSH
jgi:hypothetical protein